MVALLVMMSFSSTLSLIKPSLSMVLLAKALMIFLLPLLLDSSLPTLVLLLDFFISMPALAQDIPSTPLTNFVILGMLWMIVPGPMVVLSAWRPMMVTVFPSVSEVACHIWTCGSLLQLNLIFILMWILPLMLNGSLR